ncbi:hypothetical protein AB0M28_28175 [Streptomyces sp. NPDC051940]|uniref:hypothetical protein n=1 Tax=Streptomyces sp. NPDC051940 TaxID=3155675 RepID=UPI00342A433C
MTTVLLLGRTHAVIDTARDQLQAPGLEILGATDAEGVRTALANASVDHVIMGAGLDLETRLAVIAEVFGTTDGTTVHMKDTASGPEGFLPFARALLAGLAEWKR